MNLPCSLLWDYGKSAGDTMIATHEHRPQYFWIAGYCWTKTCSRTSEEKSQWMEYSSAPNTCGKRDGNWWKKHTVNKLIKKETQLWKTIPNPCKQYVYIYYIYIKHIIYLPQRNIPSHQTQILPQLLEPWLGQLPQSWQECGLKMIYLFFRSSFDAITYD